jgi:hypothetical protein
LTLYEFRPSSAFADDELGAIFSFQGKKFILVDRDPWTATAVRWTWLDSITHRFGVWLGKKIGRQYIGEKLRRELAESELPPTD